VLGTLQLILRFHL